MILVGVAGKAAMVLSPPKDRRKARVHLILIKSGAILIIVWAHCLVVARAEGADGPIKPQVLVGQRLGSQKSVLASLLLALSLFGLAAGFLLCKRGKSLS